MNYELTIGLEVHVQLKTQAKLFSHAPVITGDAPNTHANTIDRGMPGMLPSVNKKAIEHAIRFGLATDAEIFNQTQFARKHYFYPDSPKGYQTTQARRAIVENGSLFLSNHHKKIRILRAHLEEDAGKLIHDALPSESLIDLNRAGTPLLEIVTEPDFSSASEVLEYLHTLHQLVKFIGISDANMQNGEFRCDVNISIKKPDDLELGTRTEIKNLNSFKFIEQAIQSEYQRQINIIQSNQKIIQETRGFNTESLQTYSLRSKESAADYRYLLDPDLMPIEISQNWIKSIQNNLPDLPQNILNKLTSIYKLSKEDINRLMQEPGLYYYFESAVQAHSESYPDQINSKTYTQISNWVLGEVLQYSHQNYILTSDLINTHPIQPIDISDIVYFLNQNVLSSTLAKKAFELKSLDKNNLSIQEIIVNNNLEQTSDTGELEEIINQVLNSSPEQIKQYQSGKTKIFGYFIGQAMKLSKGQADPKVLTGMFKNKLG